MSSKMNFFCIVTDHLKTLYNNDKRDKYGDRSDDTFYIRDLDPWAIFFLFIFPLIIVYFFFVNGIISFEDENLSGIIITSLSIFTALMFSLLMIVYNVSLDQCNSNNNNIKNAAILRETYSNISFAILVSICSILLFIIAELLKNLTSFNLLIYQINDIGAGPSTFILFFSYYLLFVFIFHLFMILKRAYKITINHG